MSMSTARSALAKRLANANPVAALGHELRHVDFPEPSIPPRERPVVIPGGRKPRRRRGGIPDSKI